MNRSLLVGLAVAFAPLASGQYSDNANQNLALTTASSGQNQPKLAPTSDGGTWISWFDGIGTGWDVRVQRLDPSGHPVFPSGGLLVADRNYTSTQDYDISTASNGDVVLAYRNNPSGSNVVEAARVSSAGVVLWNTTVFTAVGFLAAPSITATGNNQAVVGWSINGSVLYQSLDQAGNMTWGQPTVLTPLSGSFSIGNLCSAPNASVVASIIHQTSGFGTPRHLLAQRFNSLGVPVWGTEPVTVFSAGSLQFGNFPECRTSANGTSLFTWYSASPALQCFVQVLDPNGQAQYPADGLPVSSNTSRPRIAPSAFFDSNEDVVVFWRESNTAQSQSGLYGQRVDAAGNVLWGPEGQQFVALSSDGVSQVQVTPNIGSNAYLSTVSWVTSLSFGDDRVRAMLVPADGQNPIGPIGVSTVSSGKSRLVSKSAPAPGGNAALFAWSDDRNDLGDIYVQNLGFDAALGHTYPLGTIDTACPAVGNSVNPTTGAQLVPSGSTVIGDANLILLTFGMPANTFGFYLTSSEMNFLPGAGGSQGNLCLGGFVGRLNGPGQVLNSGFGGSFSLTVDMGQLPLAGGLGSIVSGQVQHFQTWYRDNNPQPTSNFTTAVGILGL